MNVAIWNHNHKLFSLSLSACSARCYSDPQNEREDEHVENSDDKGGEQVNYREN